MFRGKGSTGDWSGQWARKLYVIDRFKKKYSFYLAAYNSECREEAWQSAISSISHIFLFYPLGDYVRALSLLTLCGCWGQGLISGQKWCVSTWSICTETRPCTVFFCWLCHHRSRYWNAGCIDLDRGTTVSKAPFWLGTDMWPGQIPGLRKKNLCYIQPLRI